MVVEVFSMLALPNKAKLNCSKSWKPIFPIILQVLCFHVPKGTKFSSSAIWGMRPKKMLNFAKVDDALSRCLTIV